MIEKLKNGPFPSLLWQGNNGFILSDGKLMIATDLDLTLGERILPPSLDMNHLAQELDYLFITHGHEDHFSTQTVQQLLKADRCRFVIPESCSEKALHIPGLAQRAIFVHPGQTLDLCGIPITCIRSVHGHIGGSVYSGASLLDCGYRFTLGGLCFYQPGDTLPLEEHLCMQDVDVLFVSPTEHNMGVKNAVLFIRMLSPKCIIFQHHSTYHEQPDNLFWTHGYVDEVMAALSESEREKCIIPNQNSVYSL